jgi:acetyltransferase-like isoleucine patch superfamily enzyme
MFVIKSYYHIQSAIKRNIYKLLFFSKITHGKNFNFRKRFSLLIEKNGSLTIGHNVFFNNDCSLSVHKKIEIGDNCIFGEGVKMYDHNHQHALKGVPIYKQGFLAESIKIGNNCWLGSNVIVLKGVTIGANSIIGSGVVVYKNIPENSVTVNEQEIRNV